MYSITGREECTLDAPNKEVEFQIGSKDTFKLKKTGSSSYEVYVPTKFGFTGNKYIDVSVKNWRSCTRPLRIRKKVNS